LPAVEIGAVFEQEPGEEVDAGVCFGDVVCLSKVGGLFVPADAEEGVGRFGLIAVLGDPERLAAVEARDLG
jgi:hypothetical protein